MRVAEGEELLVGRASRSAATSGGRSRKRGSMSPRSVTGHSVRPAFSARRPGSSTSVEAAGEGELGGVVGDPRGALGGVEDDEGAGEFRAVVVEGGDGEGLGGVEAVAAGGVAGGDAVDLEGDDLGAGLAGQDAEDRVQRADPAQGAGAPAHRLRPGEGADDGLDGLGDDLGGGAAGAVEDGERGCRPSCRGGSRAASRARPVARRKPSIAVSGASARGPLRSSRRRGEASARPSTARVRRRGVAKAAAWA